MAEDESPSSEEDMLTLVREIEGRSVEGVEQGIVEQVGVVGRVQIGVSLDLVVDDVSPLCQTLIRGTRRKVIVQHTCMEKKLCLDPERKREPKDLLKLLSSSAVASRVCLRRCDRSCRHCREAR
jgi:hypothetical protein